MRKTTLFILMLFVVSNFGFGKVFAQDSENGQPIEITMLDGSVKNGTIEKPIDMNSKTVKLKNGETAEKVEVQNIEKVALMQSGYPIYYYSLAYTDGGSVKKKKRLMLASITTGNVKLYAFAWGASNFRPVYNMQALNTAGVSYYAKRDNEEFATMISLDDGNSINRNSIFKNRAVKYFADDPELVEKIKNKDYKFTDVFRLVVDYNQKHGN